MTQTVTIHQRLAGTDTELLVIQGLCEAANAGHIHGLHVNRDDEIIVGREDGAPVAFVTFQEYDQVGEFWVGFGYCTPEFRRKGHYRGCIAKLREVAKSRGYEEIHTAVHPVNDAARQSIEARGGKLHYLSYVFPV